MAVGPVPPTGPFRWVDSDPAQHGLDRTAAFYRRVGMQRVARHEGYMLMGLQGVDLHFAADPSGGGGGPALVLIPDARQLWTQLKSQDAPGLG